MSGLALEVNKTGKIDRVLFNDVSDHIVPGSLLPTIFDRMEFSSALDFLNRLRNEKMVLDVPLSLSMKGKIRSFYFSGVEKGEKFVLMATSHQGADANIYDEIAKVNNELANQLRDSMKSNFAKTLVEEPELEEFTKLNNELVNIQRELNKTNRKLEELNERKNELIGVAAHDLRNPLGVITGYIQFVKGTSKNLEDGQVQMLDKAIETAQKMTGMLEELLDMSELESGKVNLNLSEVDLCGLLAEDVALNQVIAERKDIHIDLETPPRCVIQIDAPKIEQVINNFISNAIKYSHTGTRVKVSLEEAESRVWVKVKDEGQGIPRHEMKKVFEPFKTTSVKATGGEKSTGLGLAITKKVVEAHDGVIGVKSEVGMGSEFYFHLPKP